MAPAAMRRTTTMKRVVCLCIRTQDSRRRSELDVSLDEDPVLLWSSGRIVVHLLVGHDKTDTIARPDPPVRAAGDHTSLGVVAQRLVRIERIHARERGPAGHSLSHFDEA